jgi:hypothetical protein
MHITRLILIILIAGGIGLLVTETLWAPAAVTKVPSEAGADVSSSVVTSTPPVPVSTSSTSSVETEGWVAALAATPADVAFIYPETLATRFITPVNWPPSVTRTEGPFRCTEGGEVTSDGLTMQFTSKVIEGETYCIGTAAEGAAGSTYTTYQYATKRDDAVVTVAFTLRTPQCLNYDNPLQQECLAEQASFAVDALASRILMSTVPNNP